MDPIAIMSSIKSAIDLARGIKDVVADSELKIKTSELVDTIIAIQGIVLSLQSENQSLLQSNYELTQKIVKFESWEKEKKKYKLIEISKGVVVFAFDSSQDPSIPSHYICKNCYNDHQASILDPIYIRNDGSRYSCPRCKAEFTTNVDTQIPFDDDY